MEENARKRKRDEDDDEPSEGESSSESELGTEKPLEGLKRGDLKPKKQKKTEDTEKDEEALKKAEERRKLKEQKKAEKKAAQKERKKAKEAEKKAKKQERQQQQKEQNSTAAESIPKESEPKEYTDKQDPPREDNSDDDDAEDDVAAVEGFSLNEKPEQHEHGSTASSTPNSPGFDASNPHSGSSSISSIVPADDDAQKQKQKPTSSDEPKPLKPTPEELRQRLQKRLDELRAARHADGLNGKPARNRQELIEARRQKAEQRKQHKKEMRRKAKEQEQKLKDEAMARRFSPGGSGSLLASPRSPAESTGSGSNNNYAFGRIAFADGQQVDPSLSTLLDTQKRHGPQDPATALKAAEAKKARLASMDPEKRKEIEEKDMWLNAKKRAHGERVRDDTSLLKKALKRKESAKKKSEREWKERLEGVQKGKEMRQAKREENIRKRKEEKGAKKGGKARPGFEGSFKAKVGGKKK